MDEDMSGAQLIITITSLLGVIGTLIVSIGTYLKSKAEAYATVESADDDDLEKFVKNTASSLLSGCMEEILLLKESLSESRAEVKELKVDLEATDTQISTMKIQLAVLKRRNTLYVKASTELANAVRESINIRNELRSELGPDCSACNVADEALLEQLKVIEKRLKKGESIDK